MPKIDVDSVSARTGSGYPAPFDAPCAGRTRRRLGDAGGLRDFGVNLMTLPPGGWSSQRHWQSDEDEFVYLLEGELKLVEDTGETLLRAGDCAAFPKGTGNTISGAVDSQFQKCTLDTQELQRWLLGVLAAGPSLKLYFSGRDLHTLSNGDI